MRGDGGDGGRAGVAEYAITGDTGAGIGRAVQLSAICVADCAVAASPCGTVGAVVSRAAGGRRGVGWATAVATAAAASEQKQQGLRCQAGCESWRGRACERPPQLADPLVRGC